MQGELLSLLVALMWTFTALFAEIASKRIGSLTLNVWRMMITITLLCGVLWCMCGSPLPQYATIQVWLWFLLSGFMGFVFGDYCLFNAYIVIGSRYGQLFMTLASPFATLAAWVLMGERMTALSLLGMLITILGISISILGKDDTGSRRITLPLRGILLGIGTGMGQGVGLVLSKIGLVTYAQSVPSDMANVTAMMPFAGTLMRAVMGLLGFGVALVFTRQCSTMSRPFHDAKAAAAGIGAILLGPFFGVSLSLMAVGMTNAGVAQTLMSLTPILILLPSRIMFGTKISVQEVIGACIAVAGVSLFFV